MTADSLLLAKDNGNIPFLSFQKFKQQGASSSREVPRLHTPPQSIQSLLSKWDVVCPDFPRPDVQRQWFRPPPLPFSLAFSMPTFHKRARNDGLWEVIGAKNTPARSKPRARASRPQVLKPHATPPSRSEPKIHSAKDHTRVRARATSQAPPSARRRRPRSR
jgi:hypothetical protein